MTLRKTVSKDSLSENHWNKHFSHKAPGSKEPWVSKGWPSFIYLSYFPWVHGSEAQGKSSRTQTSSKHPTDLIFFYIFLTFSPSKFTFPPQAISASCVKQYCISCSPTASDLATALLVNHVIVEVRSVRALMWDVYCTWGGINRACFWSCHTQ